MKKIIHYIIPAFILVLPATLQAQQTPVISQYMMNKYLINPALAGVKGYTNINFTARQQYNQLQNAPRTFFLSGDTRLLEDSWIRRKQKVEKKRKPRMPAGTRMSASGDTFTMTGTGLLIEQVRNSPMPII